MREAVAMTVRPVRRRASCVPIDPTPPAPPRRFLPGHRPHASTQLRSFHSLSVMSRDSRREKI